MTALHNTKDHDVEPAQAQLAELEESLDSLDTALSAREARDIDNGSVRNDQTERKELLGKIQRQLEVYDSLLCHYLQLKARPSASKMHRRNVGNWVFNSNGASDEKEVEFINKEDLIAVTQIRKSPARYFFERKILVPTKGLFGLLTKRLDEKTTPSNHQTIVQGKDEHVNIIATVTIFLLTAAMLIAPLWILAGEGGIHQKLTVISVFLIVFLSVLTWGTVAKPFEALAATAGYSAVLVVFLQLGTSSISQ